MAVMDLQWRLLRTPVGVGRRTLQRRVFWHKIQNIILPQARGDAGFGTVASGEVFTSSSGTTGRDVVATRR